MGYGPVALHMAGTAEVRFKDIAIKDLNRKTEPTSQVSSHFQMQQLSDFFYSWGATAGDINHDGIPDVVAGPFYFLGPDYTERHEFTTARSYSASNNFPEGMVYFAYDYTGDGWQDIICVDSRPIYLYVNPKGESRRWDRYNVVPSATSEIEVFRDIDGDGKPEILFAGPNAMMAYAKPDPANPTGVWKVHNISEPGLGGAHGMGVGDINGDGRMDVVNSRGWWEQPASGAGETLWKFHPAQFGTGGAEMGVYDVNGDGLDDVVTAMAAHGWGIAWFEQKREAGNITFVRHDIMGDLSTKNAGGVAFSEPHGAAFADMDGDGVPDLIIGKRLYSHLESHLDPDPYGPAVLYWYRTVRNPKAEGGAEFVPELIHNRSGVGSQFVVTDLNSDGAPDIVISCVKGTFIFWNQMQPRPSPREERTNLLKGQPMKAISVRYLSIAIALFVTRLLLSKAQKGVSWSEYLGGPDSSHYSPLKQVNTRNVNKLEVAWSYATGDEMSYTFCPLVVDNIAYVAAKQGALVALDATTGKELWVHNFGAGGRFSGIAGQRGANYWESKDRTDRRIFVTSGGMLHAH